MALVINVAGMVQTKASRDRASAEIAALSASMESYKADNGIYPQTAETDVLDPRVDKTASQKYKNASLALYKELSGDTNADFTRNTDEERALPVYFEFETRKGIVEKAAGGKVTAITDPWGDSYGYSTAYAAALQKNAADNTNTAITTGYNPTFDLWSVANAKDGNEEKWVKNW
jgi:hypothetical protein